MEILEKSCNPRKLGPSRAPSLRSAPLALGTAAPRLAPLRGHASWGGAPELGSGSS